MVRACESQDPADPELLLRRVIAAYTQREATDPKVIEAAARVHAVYEVGFGSVTWDFSDNHLLNVRPQANVRFSYPRGT